MGDGVAGDLTDVHHEAVPTTLVGVDPVAHEALLAGHRLGRQQEVGEVDAMFAGDGVGVGYVALRDHEDMRRCLRVEVTERVARLRLDDAGRRNLVVDDAAEQAVAHLCEPTRVDEDLGSDFTRLVGDTRSRDVVRARVRERHLRDAAGADATVLGIALDLAEEGAEVVVSTDVGRPVAGRIAMVTADTLAIGSSYIPLRAVVAIRRPPGRSSSERPTGQRPAPRSATFAVLIAELALERPRVAVAAIGEPALLTGELRGAGADVVTIRLDGTPPVLAYVSLASVSTVTLLASG